MSPRANAVLQRFVGNALQAPIDVGDQRIAGHRCLRREARAGNHGAGSVDDDALAAGLPAQVRVVGKLQPVFPDDVVGRIAARLETLVLFFVYRTDVADEMRAGLSVRIVACRLHFEVDPGQRRQHFRDSRDRRDREITGEHHRTVRFARNDLVETGVCDTAMMQQAVPQLAAICSDHVRERIELSLDVGYLGGD